MAVKTLPPAATGAIKAALLAVERELKTVIEILDKEQLEREEEDDDAA